jgi:hypothetical protein
MKRFAVYFLVCSVMLVTASGALAQQYVNPCAGDIAKFCSNVQPGKGYIADCLSRNEAQLSPKCRSMHLEDLAEVVRQMHQVCTSDTQKFCAREQMQSGAALMSCMWSWRGSLSPDCNTKFLEVLELLRY